METPFRRGQTLDTYRPEEVLKATTLNLLHLQQEGYVFKQLSMNIQKRHKPFFNEKFTSSPMPLQQA